MPNTRSWSIGLQRAISRRHGGRHPLRRHAARQRLDDRELERDQRLRERIPRRVQARAGEPARPRCGRLRHGHEPGLLVRVSRAGTGTSPLPTYLAYFARIPAARANDVASYTGVTQFTNSAWTGHLGEYEPDPVDAGNDLHANATFRANALAAGLPANFFVLNPDVDQANITRDAATTKYDALQIDFRRRLSRGLTASVNYTYAKTYETDLDTLRRDRAVILADDGVPHAFKTTWYYEIPVGRGKRFGTNINPWLNGLVGNWEFSGTGRLQVRDFRIDDASRLVGMTRGRTAEGVQGGESARRGRLAGRLEPAAGHHRQHAPGVEHRPDVPDRLLRRRRADRTLYRAGERARVRRRLPERLRARRTTSTCAVRSSRRFDFSFKKRFPFGRRASFDLQLDLLNALDNVNFNPTFDVTPAANTTAFQITSGYTDINTTFDPGGRIGQIVWRLNW